MNREEAISRQQCIDAVNKIVAQYVPKIYIFTLSLELEKAITYLPSVSTENPNKCSDIIGRQAVKEQMIKYGFLAPDMTVTEFIETLPSVNTQANKEDIHREREQAYMEGYEHASKRYRTGAMEMTAEEINRIKYIVCCPMCDNKKCVRKTDKCEAEIWAKKNKRESWDKE